MGDSADLSGLRIRLGAGDGVYRHGERLTGSVVVELSRPMTLRAVKLQVKGRAVWGEESKKGAEVEKVFVNRDIVLLERPPGQPVAGEWDWGAGSHVLPFECPLPRNAPTTFEGGRAFVRYFARATLLQRLPGKAAKDRTFVTKAPFTLLGPPPASISPELLQPIGTAESASVSGCCCMRGRLNGEMGLPKSVFVSGETVFGSLKVQNRHSRQPIDVVIVQLVECVRKEGGNGPIHRRVITEKRLDRSAIAPKENWSVENLDLLQIPAVAPSFRLESLYSLSYELRVQAGKRLAIPLGLTIGNIPLSSDDGAPPPTGFSPFVLGPQTVRDADDPTDLLEGAAYTPLYPVFEGASLNYPNPSPRKDPSADANGASAEPPAQNNQPAQ